MKISVSSIKLVIIFFVGLFLPWGRNSINIGIYPPLFFIVATLCLSIFLFQNGIKIPKAFRWFLAYISIHIFLTTCILGKDYLFSTHFGRQLLSSGQYSLQQITILTNITQILFLVYFFVVVVSVIKREQDFIVFIFSFLCGLFLVCIFKLLVYGSSVDRFTGGYGDPNVFGIAACISFFLSLMLVGLARQGILKILGLFLAVFSFVMILLSQSRGAFAALLLGGYIVMKERKFSTYKIIILGFFLFMAFIVIRPFIPERLLALDLWVADRGTGRLDIWKIYLSHFFEYFFTGVGYARSPDVISTGILRKEFVEHNIFLEILVEFGIVGLFLFCRVLSDIWISLRNLNKVASYGAELKAIFFSWILGACFLNSFLQRETWFVFSLMSTFMVLSQNRRSFVRHDKFTFFANRGGKYLL